MNIKEIRVKCGMNRSQFAKSLGVAYQTVLRWENENIEPREHIKAKIMNLIDEQNSPGLLINIKKLNPNAVIPTRGSKYSAGYDLYACIDSPVLIEPHKSVKIGTGLAFEIPEGYFGAIVARSGLATKLGLRPANCIGVCDSDYRGEYIIALHNDSEKEVTVNSGERIAQLVIMPFLSVGFTEVSELSSTDRGEGGFGSTGK